MKKEIFRVTGILFLSILLLGGCNSKSAGSYHKQGLDYFKSGDYEKAEESLSKALELNPDRAEYYIDYAMVFVQMGKYDVALEFFDKAILDKDNAIVNKNNKEAYRGKGITYYKAHDYKKAIKQFDQALAIDELSTVDMDILYYKADAQVKAGQYKEALKTYSSILQDNPKDAAVYNNRAKVYLKLGDSKKSLEDYNQAIKLDDKDYDYYFGKYFLMLETGDEKGAASVLEIASKIKGTTQEDKYNLAKVHYYMGDYDAAIPELSEAFRNGFAEAYFYLGNIYEKEEDYESAVYNYSKYIEEEKNINSAEVFNKIGICLLKEKNYSEALSYIKSGLEYNDLSFHQALMRNEIVAYENLGEFKKAYDVMKNYRKRYPDDEEAVKENTFLKTRLP